MIKKKNLSKKTQLSNISGDRKLILRYKKPQKSLEMFKKRQKML